MERLIIIPESIWEKIEKDKALQRRRRAEEHINIIRFCAQYEELHYVIGLDKKKPKQQKQKSTQKPKVRRVTE